MERILRRCLFAVGPAVAAVGPLVALEVLNLGGGYHSPTDRWAWGMIMALLGFSAAAFVIGIAVERTPGPQGKLKSNGLDLLLWITGMVVSGAIMVWCWVEGMFVV